jgi:hypothetical protein
MLLIVVVSVVDITEAEEEAVEGVVVTHHVRLVRLEVSSPFCSYYLMY